MNAGAVSPVGGSEGCRPTEILDLPGEVAVMTMTTRTILETLSRNGYAASILHFANGTVAVRAVHHTGHLVRASGIDELHAAVAVWNRLGCAPRLAVRGGTAGDPAAEPVREDAARSRRRADRFGWISDPFRMLLRGL